MAFELELLFSSEHHISANLLLAFTDYSLVRGDPVDFSRAFTGRHRGFVLHSHSVSINPNDRGTSRLETIPLAFPFPMGLFIQASYSGDRTRTGSSPTVAAYVAPVSDVDRLTLQFEDPRFISGQTHHRQAWPGFKKTCVVRCADGRSSPNCIDCPTDEGFNIRICC